MVSYVGLTFGKEHTNSEFSELLANPITRGLSKLADILFISFMNFSLCIVCSLCPRSGIVIDGV